MPITQTPPAGTVPGEGQYDYMWMQGTWWRNTGGGNYSPTNTPPPQGARINPIYAAGTAPPPPGWWDNIMNPPSASNPPAQNPNTPLPSGITTDEQSDLESEYPQEAFNAGLRGRGLNTEGTLGGLLRKQYGATAANYSLGNLLGQSPTSGDAAGFQQYTQQVGPNAYGTARNIYSQVQGGGPVVNPNLRDALYNAKAGDSDEENYSDQRGFQNQYLRVAQSAARRRYSPFSARYLPSEQETRRRIDQQLYDQGQRGPAAQGVNLPDLLKQWYGF